MTVSTTTKPLRRRLGFAQSELLIVLALLVVALGVVLLILNRGGGTNAPPPPSQEQIDAKLGILQQDFQTALNEQQDLARIAGQARAFTEDYPDQQGGYVLLAQARMGLKQWGEAYAAWKRALEFDSGALELNKMAGLCAAKLGRDEDALSHYQQAAANEKADNEVFAALGRLHLSLDDADSAEAMFEKAVEARGAGEKMNYKHGAYAGLADVASVRGETDTALEWIDRAIRMAGIDSSADTAGYHIQKARIYMDAERDDDAMTMLGYTWSEFPKSQWRIESARLRARLYERAGQLDAAVDHLQTLTEVLRQTGESDDETLANFTALLADWQIKADRIDAAKISLHNLETMSPGHPGIEELKAKLR